jgi:predicted alpha/beta-fold hydrolase
MRTRFPEAARGLRLSGITSLRDFDDRVTAPVHGFAGAEDYYSRCSSGQFLHAIRIPTLLLSARDDPFLPREVLRRIEAAAENNPALSTDFVERGGHVGFVCGRNPMRPIYYAEERVCSFLVDASGLRKE